MAGSLGGGQCLRVQELDFEGNTPAKAPERAVRADDAVTGHDMHHRIGAYRLTHRPGRFGTTYTVCNMLVGGHHAYGYVQQITPHLQLERGAIQVQAKTRHLVIATTEQQERLLVQRDGTATEARSGKMPPQRRLGFPLHRGGHQETDAFGGGGNQNTPEGGGVGAVADGEGLLLAQELLPRHRLNPDAAMFYVVHFK